MECPNRRGLVSDILYFMVGMDCTSIKIRKGGQGFFLAVHESLSKDEKRIVNSLSEVLLGSREVRYKTEELYYTKEYTKHSLLKGIEKEMENFADRVCQIRKSFLNEKIEMEGLVFVFQKDIALFRSIRGILRELDRTEGVFLLQTILDSALPEESSGMVASVLRPVNRILKQIAEGETPSEYFEEKRTYDYGECFWTSCYRKKETPKYLAERLEEIFALGKVSKIRRECGEASAPLASDVLSQKGKTVVFNEFLLREHLSSVSLSGPVHAMWKEGVGELFSTLMIETCKYTELFKEMGEKIFRPPADREMSFVNYVLRKGCATFSPVDEKIAHQSFSFAADSAFLFAASDEESASQVSFVHNSASLSKTLDSIQDTKIKKGLPGTSFLQGLDVQFSLRQPLSSFFSTKAVSEMRIFYRIIYSLYAIEHVLCAYYSHWRIRQILLTFVTGMRMYMTEKIREEAERLQKIEEIPKIHPELEDSLANIMKASLLVAPPLVQFYSSFFSLSFYYLELAGKEAMREDEIEEVVEQYRALFKGARPYVKPFFLSMIFESLCEMLAGE